MGKFGEWKDWKDKNPEKWQKKMEWCKEQWKNKCGGMGGMGCGGNWDKQSWKQQRAVIQRKPEEILEIAPGMTQFVEIEVLNDTFWPWKKGCSITLADEQSNFEIPIEVFNIPVEQEVKGKSTATFQLPLTMAQHIVADADKVYELFFTFRGPMGMPFGSPISIKMKCVIVLDIPQVSDVEIYKLAIKFHEQLQLGSLDDCIKAVRENNGDETESIKALQRKEQ